MNGAPDASSVVGRFHENLCTRAEVAATIVLTADRRRELALVQQRVNAEIVYGRTPSWDPLIERGDCKNYAARKELELLQLGWPAGAMRLATAFIEDRSEFRDEYHAVLLVDTTEGTFVLDNLQATPLPYDSLNYVWVMSQVPGRSDWARLPTDDLAFGRAFERHRLLRSWPVNAAQ
jgi:predicted transglutaminase-like cysteine proteinase